MKTVKSEDLGVSITGNILTHHNLPISHIGNIVHGIGEGRQFTIVQSNVPVIDENNKLYDISYPMTSKDHAQYAGLIHRLNALSKIKLKTDNNEGPDGDGTPPSGGTPVLQKLEFVEAIAA